MNFELSEEQIALRDMARKFAADVIAPNARSWDRENNIPDEVYKQLGELGFMGLMIPIKPDSPRLRRKPSSMPRKWPAGSPTGPCRFMAERDMSMIPASNNCIATPE